MVALPVASLTFLRVYTRLPVLGSMWYIKCIANVSESRATKTSQKLQKSLEKSALLYRTLYHLTLIIIILQSGESNFLILTRVGLTPSARVGTNYKNEGTRC